MQCHWPVGKLASPGKDPEEASEFNTQEPPASQMEKAMSGCQTPRPKLFAMGVEGAEKWAKGVGAGEAGFENQWQKLNSFVQQFDF